MGEETQFRRRVQAGKHNKGVPMRRLTALLRCERGANAIEYALVASLMAVAAYSAFEQLGNKIDVMYNNIGNKM